MKSEIARKVQQLKAKTNCCYRDDGTYDPSLGAQRSTRKDRSRCTSIYRGVNWDKTKKGWVSRIFIPNTGKMLLLGKFDNEHDAARAYNIAAKELYGEHAYQNIIDDET